MPRPTRIQMPVSAKKGEVIQIKTIIQHDMETGYRRDSRGLSIPRRIVKSYVATYNGVEIFRAETFPGISANPYFSFTTVATETGVIEFTWTDDHGEVTSERRPITVV